MPFEQLYPGMSVLSHVTLHSQIASCRGQMKIRRANIGVVESSFKQNEAILRLTQPNVSQNLGSSYKVSFMKVGQLQVDWVTLEALYRTTIYPLVNLWHDRLGMDLNEHIPHKNDTRVVFNGNGPK